MADKVLIVDDEEMIRDLVKVSIKDLGVDTYEAQDGVEALEKVKEVKPDLVVLDILMPNKDGFRVCSEIKENPETSGIYILIITSRDTVLTQIALKRTGADDILFKPFDPKELKEKVKKGLGLF
ncbi:MAG: response regulator [Deltaproteobacteria bacterium]|nr:MAG: response regulator [Deltaproteobacteria bacterium]